MPAVTAFTATDPFAPELIIVDAARCWRDAIDRHRPALPILVARLETRGAEFLAPAIAALLSIHEAWSGRRFNAGDQSASALTTDERTLLGLLETAAPAAACPAQPGLAGPLRIALRSTRILARRVLGRDLAKAGAMAARAADTPIFFAYADDASQLPCNSDAATQTDDAA